MNKLSLMLASALGVATVGLALPAYAGTAPAPSSTNTVILITGGALSITTPSAAAALVAPVQSGGDSVFTGNLGAVTVTDLRRAQTGWSASVSSTDWAASNGQAAIPAGASTYTVNGTTPVGAATNTYGDTTPVTTLGSALSTVVTALNVTGNNADTWNPLLKVTVPAGVLAATFTATITHSVV